MSIILWLIATPLFLFLVGLILYNAAKHKQQATFVKEGTIEFVVSGGALVDIFVNVRGYALAKDGTIVQVGEDTGRNVTAEDRKTVRKIGWLQRYLREKWGFYWVSLFFPWRRIHRFQIAREKILSRAQVSTDAPIRERIRHDPSPNFVDNLRFRFPRPFLVAGVETEDRFTTNLLLQGVIQVVNPYIPVFLLEGKFFAIIEAALSSALIQLLGKMTFAKFVAMTKEERSEFALSLLNINNEGGGDKTSRGLVQSAGVRIIDIWIEEFELDKGDDKALEALKAGEIATKIGEADVKKAEKDREAAVLRAEGNAAEVSELMKAYSGGDPATARIVAGQVVSRNLGQNSNLRVLAGSGAMPSIMIDAGDNPPSGSAIPPAPATRSVSPDKRPKSK